jgi:hypothetical protein
VNIEKVELEFDNMHAFVRAFRHFPLDKTVVVKISGKKLRVVPLQKVGNKLKRADRS